jgi:hypothetical protein
MGQEALKMSGNSKTWRGALIACVAVSLLFSSGCALLLISGGAAGGYMIRKGEEGDGPSKKESSQPTKGSSLQNAVELKVASASQAETGSLGDTR